MVIQVQKEIKPKKYEFLHAYKKALEDGDIIITSLKSKELNEQTKQTSFLNII